MLRSSRAKEGNGIEFNQEVMFVSYTLKYLLLIVIIDCFNCFNKILLQPFFESGGVQEYRTRKILHYETMIIDQFM